MVSIDTRFQKNKEISTVEYNKSYFSTNHIEGAKNAVKSQQIIGWTITSKFKFIIKKQLINYCNVIINDINRSELIYGPATPLLKGKMTRYQPNSDKIERVPLPLPISEYHKDVQLYINFFFVNGCPFLAIKLAKLNFFTAHPCKSRSTAQIKKIFDMLLEKYDACGFNLTIVHGNNEFNIAQLK